MIKNSFGNDNFRRNASNPNRFKSRERGKIVSLKPSFGFIRSTDRPEQLFFHLTSVCPTQRNVQSFRVGDDVEFDVESGGLNNRPAARGVRLLPKGSVVFEQMLRDEGRKRATVTRELVVSRLPRETQPGEVCVESNGERLCFNSRDLDSTFVRLLVGDVVDISVYIDVKTRRRGATHISLVAPSDKNRERGIISGTHSNNYGFIRCAERDEQKLFFHFSERLDNNYIPLEGHGLEFNVTRDKSGRICASRITRIPEADVKFVKVLPTVFRGVVKEGLKSIKNPKSNISKLCGGVIALKTTVVDKEVIEHLYFDKEGVSEENGNQKLMPNDQVSFKIGIFKPTGRRHASRIKIESKAQQNREKGIVAHIKENDYGFIERPATERNIFFKVEDTSIKVGDCVEYTVIRSEKSKDYADDIKALPKGSVVFHRFSAGFLSGLILCEAKRPKKFGDKTADSVSGGSSVQKGLIGFCDPEENHKEKTIDYTVEDLVCPKIELREGDIVKFRKKEDLRFGRNSTASHVELEKPASGETRQEGIVMNLRNDFGFLTCFSHPNGLFFHFSNVIGNSKNRVKCGDEFSFDISDDFRGKKMASRLLKLPKNSVVLDDVDPDVFLGKVGSTGYEFSRDIGFHGNGLGSIQYCNSDIYNDIILNLSADAVINEKNNREIVKHIKSLSFRSSDLLCSPLSLSKGDFVRFQIVAEKATGQLRAAKISVLPKLGCVRSVPIAPVPGEVQSVFTKEFFDFKANEHFEEDSFVLFDVYSDDRPISTKRKACNLRVGNYLVLEKGFFEGYVKEIIPVQPDQPKNAAIEKKKIVDNSDKFVGQTLSSKTNCIETESLICIESVREKKTTKSEIETEDGERDTLLDKELENFFLREGIGAEETSNGFGGSKRGLSSNVLSIKESLKEGNMNKSN